MAHRVLAVLEGGPEPETSVASECRKLCGVTPGGGATESAQLLGSQLVAVAVVGSGDQEPAGGPVRPVVPEGPNDGWGSGGRTVLPPCGTREAPSDRDRAGRRRREKAGLHA